MAYTDYGRRCPGVEKYIGVEITAEAADTMAVRQRNERE
jgi:hypothetical protein